MNTYRSETMQYFKVVIPKDNCIKILSGMETFGNTHFVDRNGDTLTMKRTFSDLISRCSNILVLIQNLKAKMQSLGIQIFPQRSIRTFYEKHHAELLKSQEPDQAPFLQIEKALEEFHVNQELIMGGNEINARIVATKKRLFFLQQVQQLLPKEYGYILPY